MSFSGDMRAELAQNIPSGRRNRDTALAALLANIGQFSASEDGGTELRLLTGNRAALRKCFTLILKTVNISPDSSLYRIPAEGMRKEAPEKDVSEVRGQGGDGARELPKEFLKLLRRLKIVDRDGTFRENDGTLDESLLEGTGARAYLREMFLCTGFMNDPRQRYHLEFRCFSEPQAGQLREVLVREGIHAGQVSRKRYYVVYVKDSEDIVTLLHLMGAHVALMATENARIYKDLRNSVNRRVNCETANIGKTVASAGRQLEDIRFLKEIGVLQDLPLQLQEAAALREENPGASLSELGALAQPPVGRSGINHRMRKIGELAEKYRRDSGK